jgi:hypothetical protein
VLITITSFEDCGLLNDHISMRWCHAVGNIFLACGK